MIEQLLGLDEAGPVTYFEFLLRSNWPRLVILALAAAAVAYAVYLYRKEQALTRGRRIVLGVLRAAVLALLVLLVFEPILGLEMSVKARRTLLVLLDTSESMSTRDPRQSEEELKDAALALDKVRYDDAAQLTETARAAAAAAGRIDMAKGILAHPGLRLMERLAENYTIRYFGFGERLEPTQGKGETAPDALLAAQATARFTRMGSAIAEAVDRSAGQPIAGVIVLTDGISNDGLEPLPVAQRLGERSVPIYPVALGLASAPDVAVRRLIVPDVVFHKDKVPLRVQISSGGYAGRTANLTVALDGQEIAGKLINLSGKTQFEEVLFIPETRSGNVNLEVSVAAAAGETNPANNKAARTLRVISERIKVLYVEGKPRWEYRYLRQVLLRDPRLEVKFLLTEGDRDQAISSDAYLTDFPEEAARAFHFDLIILGDVPATYFSHAQMTRIEELVQKHGGSFLMLAGGQHAPLSYIGSPVANILPVRVRTEGWQNVDDGVFPVIPEGTADSAIMTLDVPKDRNQELWARVRPMYKLPVLEGAKPAATVLATLSRGAVRAGETYPLIAWQRYGSGKSLFVGTDQLWRLRFKTGDKYHARFWGQAIQFLTLSRLLGESKRIQIATDAAEYLAGQRVAVSVNVLDETYEPVKAPAYSLYLDRTAPARSVTLVRLDAVPNIPGLYQGYFTPDQAGRYEVRAPGGDPSLANTAEFTVKESQLEQIERAMQEELLRNMADSSGGRCFTVRELPKLVETVAGEQRTSVIRRERELWDLPVAFLAVLALLGVEWLLRRKYDLV
ncbi:MAG: hypothetical protein FJ288_07165 [Planctomycetes bacterium]|nr:hypothetical protein [Planctomycetota bacterium]